MPGSPWRGKLPKIFRAGSQLNKVKAFIAFTLLLAAGGLYWGWDLFNTYGLSPGDGGVLAPVGQRLAWGLSVAGLGLLMLFGMWVYGRQYTARIAYDPTADVLHVRTLQFLATREEVYAASEVVESTWHHGQMDTNEGVSVNAPWFFARFRNRRWRLIVDGQGIFPDPELAARLLKED